MRLFTLSGQQLRRRFGILLVFGWGVWALATPSGAQTRIVEQAESQQGEVGVRLEKGAQVPVPLCPSSEIHYTLRITNIGTTNGGGEIIDPIPEGITYVEGSATGGADFDAASDRIVWEGPLAVDESHTIGFSVTVDPGVPNGSSLVNVATGRVSAGEVVAETQVELPVEVDCPPPPPPEDCTVRIQGEVQVPAYQAGDGSTVFYPISESRVLGYVLDANEALPIPPLSEPPARKPSAETYTNLTQEDTFDGQHFVDPEEAEYSMTLQVPANQEEETCPPRMIVVSLLWHRLDHFAIGSEEFDNISSDRYVPLYLVQCISNRPEEGGEQGPCVPWEGEGNTFTVSDLDFTYGVDPTMAESAEIIGLEANPFASEFWIPGLQIWDAGPLEGAGIIYFFTYKAHQYLDHLAAALGVDLDPLVVTAMGTSCDACYKPAETVGFGLRGVRRPPQDPAPQGRMNLGILNVLPRSLDRPDNAEWHEAGHYWMHSMYGDLPSRGTGNTNHGGYDNSTTTDSLIEGFAEFTSMLIALNYNDPRPFQYRINGHQDNLEIDYPVWGSVRTTTGPDGTLSSFTSLTPSDEEYAVAGILWDLIDGGDFAPAKDQEVKPVGNHVSTLITTHDFAEIPLNKLLQEFLDHEPATLEDLHRALFPAFSDNTDGGDSFTDVDEIFIAHAAFDDDVKRDLKQDVAENPGGTASSKLPNRPTRGQKPMTPGAFLRFRYLGPQGEELDPGDVTLRVSIEVAPPFDGYSYDQEIQPESEDVYFVLPPNAYASEVRITAVTSEGLVSEPFVLDSADFWDQIAAGAEFVAEHTFRFGDTRTCSPTPTTLCLNDGRFAVEVDWVTDQGTRGQGQAERLTGDTGYFWFFDDSNVEMVIKVLDACDPFGRFWVFAGGLTDVEVDVSVTDVATGDARTYRNPQRTPFQPIQDVNAFATCDAETFQGGAEAARANTMTESTSLLLQDGRFRVDVAWETDQGTSGTGHGVPITEDTGYFWFFDDGNVEVVIKVLDACDPFDRFWVFAGGLTDVEVELMVTDTQTQEVRTYRNPQRAQFQPIQDTGAFATCP